MAKNDAILLDGIIKDRMVGSSMDRGEVFELFAFEQTLKNYDLTRQELDHGWVDGKDDGGIDGFYTFVNGFLVQDSSKFSWPKKSASIEIHIINCKHGDSFKQDPLNTLFPTIEELLNFEKSPEDFDGQYSPQLIRARETALNAFRQTASGLPTLNFRFVYASRGDLKELASNIESRGNQLKRIVADYFSDAKVQLDYLGATELISLHRKTRFVIELPYAEQLSSDQGAYVLLVRLNAYAKFVSDDRGNLRRYLFDSNVRDFMGQNTVNQDIAQSLADDKAPDFWWLNNGVTILATSAIPLGKTEVGNVLQLHDVQIVNGLQTTQTIHNHVSLYPDAPNSGCVLIKVIVSEDVAIRDRIIRATNNQSSVELASLTATDKIQRDIEEILEKHDWFYERRRNYYKNIGKPIERFIDPLFLAVSMVSLVRKAPHQSGRLKSRFMRDSESYGAVFSDRITILVWPKLASIMKLVDSAIVPVVPKHKSGQRIVAGWRGAIALCAVAEIMGTFDYSVQELIDLDVRLLLQKRIVEIFEFLSVKRSEILPNIFNHVKELGRADIQSIHFGIHCSIRDTTLIGRWYLPSTESHSIPQSKIVNASNLIKNSKTISLISDDVISKVFLALPTQPWPMGTQHNVARSLDLDLPTVRRAIKQLISNGKFCKQIDGVVINAEGIIISVDENRADTRHKLGELFVQTSQPVSGKLNLLFLSKTAVE